MDFFRYLQVMIKPMRLLRFNSALFLALLFVFAAPLAAKNTSEALNEAGEAVVMVTAYSKGEACGQGSGFVVDTKGVIVTNFHVIEGSDKALVSFPDGARYPVLGVSGYDPAQDMAILKIDAYDLPTLKLGNSDRLPLGAMLVAVGHPYGIENSVAQGRLVSRRSYGQLGEYLQVSVHLEPGYSGGALLDTKGRVVGITTATDRRGKNRSLAVPINRVKPLLGARKIIKLGKVNGLTQSPSEKNN